MKILQLPCGLRFGIAPEKPPTPAPTLFNFSATIKESLIEDSFCRINHIVEQHGYLCVSLDLPCHGAQARAGEAGKLDGWRERIGKGENLFELFVRQCKDVLDFLIEQKYSDPCNIAVCGTSRGGFAAAHFAAADPRVRAVIGFSPVTRLKALREFHDLRNAAFTESLSLIYLAEKLAGRSLWLTIGNRDERVNTDYAIEFARAIVGATAAQGTSKLIDVELHVLPSEGHRVPENAHAAAAEWLMARRTNYKRSQSSW